MSGKYPVTRFEQFFVAGEISAVERPDRMVIQFFVALVKTIRRSKKRYGIGNVNGHWHIQLTADVPHGIEMWIVNLDQRSRGDVFPQIESQRFKNFQASCSVTVSPLNRFGLNVWIIWLLEPGIGWLSESVEAPRNGMIIFVDGVSQTFVEATSEVHHGSNIFSVHNREQFLWRGRGIAGRC